MAPFLSNMHFALWCMAALSIVGAGVSFARPKHAGHHVVEEAAAAEPVRGQDRPAEAAAA
jgi:hypothetical protein